MTSAYDIGEPPELLLAIMSGFYRRPALSACRSPSIRCLIFHDGTQTTASPDAELVPPSEYLTNIQPPLPTPPTPLSCCDTWWRGRPPRANGSSHFFCRPHVRETLSSQYRFLPALAHAGSILLKTAALKWLVLVDDDSIIDANKLLDVLRSLAPMSNLYLGDFGFATHTYRKKDNRRSTPFACGGGGHVFDRVAISKLDFLGCARQLHQGCAQSDWMVGKCAKRSGVPPMADGNLSWTSCGFCSRGCSLAAKAQILSTIRQVGSSSGGGCVFAQRSPVTLCDRTSRANKAFGKEVCAWRADSVAIRHGWCECSQPSCKLGSQPGGPQSTRLSVWNP